MGIDSGQGITTPTTSDGQFQARISELEVQLRDSSGKITEYETTVNRLRGTQSSNDRTIAEYKSKADTYATQLTDMEAQLKAVNTDFGTAKSTIEELSSRVQGFDDMSKNIETLQTQNNRLLIAASKAASSPIIGALIANNALPVAETTELFEIALDNIISGAQSIAQVQAQSILSGAKPNPNIAATGAESPIDMKKRGEAMMMAKNIDEGLALIRKASELQAANPT